MNYDEQGSFHLRVCVCVCERERERERERRGGCMRMFFSRSRFCFLHHACTRRFIIAVIIIGAIIRQQVNLLMKKSRGSINTWTIHHLNDNISIYKHA
jgi:hypothetical protein